MTVRLKLFVYRQAASLIRSAALQLLNTVSNLGGTWPKPFVLKSTLFDRLSLFAILLP